MHRPKRIFFPFVGDSVGGSHMSAIKLIKALDPGRFDVSIGLHIDDGPLADLLRDNGLGFVRIPDIPFMQSGVYVQEGQKGVLRYLFGAVSRLRRFLIDRQVDLVHTNDGRMHANWGIASRLAGCPLLWHHRSDPDAMGVNLIGPWLASHIVSVSAFASPSRPILPIRRKHSIIHSPFDTKVMLDRQECRTRILDELSLGPETHILAYFGTLLERKRPVFFVDAVHAFMQRHPEIAVIGLIFGSLQFGSDLEKRVEDRAAMLGISDRIRLMGFRQPHEIWMSGIDILLVPALREPFGRTIIEAMQLGTPVIAVADGGNIEAIDHGRTGLLVEPERPDSFCDPIHRLLADREEWDRISRAAHQDAVTRYSTEQHVAAITDIYDRLLAPRRSSRSVTGPHRMPRDARH